MIAVHGVVWDAKKDRSEVFNQTENVIVLGFDGDRDEIIPICRDGVRHIFVSHCP